MASNFLYHLIFAGIIQGFFLSFFLFFAKENRSKSSVYLGILLLSVALSNLQNSLEGLGIITLNQFNIIYLPYLYLIAPSIYFFITTFLYPDKKTKKIEYLLYLPFVLFLGIAIIYKIVALSSGETSSNNSNQEALAYFVDVYGEFINILFILITLVFLYRITINYSKSINQLKTKTVANEILWIKVFLGVLFLTLFPWFIYTLKFWQDENTFYLPILVIASFVIYIWGYIGIHKIKILNQRKKMREYLNENKAYSIVEKPKNEHISQIEKIIVEDEGFLNPNLTLDALADELQLSKSHISRLINNELEISFNDYVNTLRVSEAKKLLLNPDFSNYTLVAIGLEAGFSSKTTFNTVFKKITHQTPSQFRKNQSNSFQ